MPQTESSVMILTVHAVFLLLLILALILLIVDCCLFFYFDVPKLIRIFKREGELKKYENK